MKTENKLEPKHLAPYLPYSLKVIMEGKKCNVAWMSTKNIAVHRPFGIGDYKKIAWKYAHINIAPILRPLSDLTDEFLSKYYISFELENGFKLKAKNELYTSLIDLEYLFKNHFDVFGLIEKGLAVDINTLNQ